MDSTSGTGVTNPQPFEQASKVLEDVWEINRTQAVQSSSSSDRHGGGGFGIGLGLGVLVSVIKAGLGQKAQLQVRIKPQGYIPPLPD